MKDIKIEIDAGKYTTVYVGSRRERRTIYIRQAGQLIIMDYDKAEAVLDALDRVVCENGGCYPDGYFDDEEVG